jgi:hypothetical protein
MYWARAVQRADLVEDTVFVHGNARLNLTRDDLAAFVDPADAALMIGFRGLDATATFADSFPVWMATMRRRNDTEAVVETLQRIFVQLADAPSLATLLLGLCDRARELGYARLVLVPQLMQESLVPPALKSVAEQLGRSIEVVPTTGLMGLPLR